MSSDTPKEATNQDKRFITNRKLFSILVALFVIIGVGSTYLLSGYFKKIALYNLAEDSAKMTSELVFETMYAKMEDGWTRKDMSSLIERLNRLKDGMSVSIYRSKLVEELYGKIDGEEEKIAKDPLLQKSLNGESVFVPDTDRNSIRYIYPIKVKSECIKCHINTKVGDVNGVIDIQIPGDDIQIPLENIVKYFVIFAAVSIFVILAVFHILANQIFIKPIAEFTGLIDQIKINAVFNEYMDFKPKTHEVYVLQTAFNRLLERINEMLADLRNRNKLLEEYKQAIDNSTIVTKTDKKGIITYVNEQFCAISGYTKEELIGKPHNIVRSPNMPASAFEDLWKTIKSKKAWHGIVENRRKNGESYFVQATIMPILDEKDEIVEYIAIRQDITELKRLQLEELNRSVNKALAINLREISGAVPFASVVIDESGAILYKNKHFDEFFAFDSRESGNIEDLFEDREGYFYPKALPGWKETLLELQDESVQKVLVVSGGVEHEFVIMLGRLSGSYYIVYLLLPTCYAI